VRDEVEHVTAAEDETETPSPANETQADESTEEPVRSVNSYATQAEAVETQGEWAIWTGALALDAIDTDQRDVVADAITASPELSRELAELKSVADILTGLYQSSPAPTATGAVPASIPAEVTAAPALKSRQPRPARTPRPALKAARSLERVPAAKVLTGTCVVIAALALLWAFALLDKISTRDDEINALSTEVASLKGSGNASTYLLYPTADGGKAQGTIFYSPANATTLIDVINLPPADEKQVYQIWFQANGSDAWQPGPTFLANAGGEAVQRLSGDAPTFAHIAISLEPSPGSSSPTGPFLATGTLAQVNG